jgi:hypothetical protein
MIVLVSAQGPQLDRPAPAKDLHTAQEFQRCRAWAEEVAERWFVLTPKHGLVEPGRKIEPYRERLGDVLMTRTWWANLVLERLLTFVSPDAGEQIVLAATQYFAVPLEQLLYEAGYRVAHAPGLVPFRDGYMPTEVEDLPPVYFQPWQSSDKTISIEEIADLPAGTRVLYREINGQPFVMLVKKGQ